MTKAEAKFISDSLVRALRLLEGVEMPWSEMPNETAKKVNANLKAATDEVKRVYEAASEEIGKK